MSILQSIHCWWLERRGFNPIYALIHSRPKKERERIISALKRKRDEHYAKKHANQTPPALE